MRAICIRCGVRLELDEDELFPSMDVDGMYAACARCFPHVNIATVDDESELCIVARRDRFPVGVLVVPRATYDARVKERLAANNRGAP
jgi:hypothetical protein